MVEPFGLAASAIAVIELSAQVAALCLKYSTAVRNAESDINCLQSRVKSLHTAAEGVRRLLDGPDGATLETSRELLDSLGGCWSQLAQLQTRLDSGKARKMRRYGFR